MRKAIRRSSVVAGVVLASAAGFSADPPDLKINPTSGLIEVVDAAWSGSNYNVRFSQTTTEGDLVGSTLLTSNSAPDVDPRIASASGGETVVVWWRDVKVDLVIYRLRSAATGAFGPERTVGRTTESSSRPRIVYSGGSPWVAYQIQNANKSRSVGAQIIDDDPEPFRSIIATTTYTGDLDVQIDSEMNHLWVTWIDNATHVGYSEYDAAHGLWGVPRFEAFSTDTVAAARSRIRVVVLSIVEGSASKP
jgi:hypothetical protein